ncbi:hypothetical protein [Streptomyces lydicus]|uniref:hypothetical protein n=1 Tax=Streptomyces lydicus TaxID=47763 RepID=UPI0037BBBB28
MAYPLDTKVVIQLQFMFAEQSRQGPGEPLRVTPLTVLERLRELGVVSGNGSRLVGRDAVYESFVRLTAKGYIRRLEPRGEKGRKAGVSYEFYDFPEFNPDPKVREMLHALRFGTAFSQVSSTSGIAGSGDAESNNRQSRENYSTAQLAPPSGIATYGIAGSGNADQASTQVNSTSGNAGSPPLPPEEDSSSPYPSTTAAGSGTGEEEDPVINDEQIAAAMDFLQELPEPWQAGPTTAKKLAPTLATIAAERSWKLDDALAKKLTKNPGGIRSYAKVLAIRIQDLPHKRSQPAPRKRPDAQPVPQRPHNVVPSEEGMVAVRAALQAMHGTLRRP